ncbi:hypothetical protein [Acinetobacter proteolyticus]|nr:hypothetical protein [Acinetobacter proteolyticus]
MKEAVRAKLSVMVNRLLKNMDTHLIQHYWQPKLL